MKNLKTITIITLLFSLFVLASSIVDFAALHDIYKDYVSHDILAYLNITPSSTLPDWTNTEGEWDTVTFNFLIRNIFLVLNTIVLFYIYKNIIPKVRAGNQ